MLEADRKRVSFRYQNKWIDECKIPEVYPQNPDHVTVLQ